LLETLKSISGAAERCGFSDSAYFARVFAKITRCSFKEYRDNPVRFDTHTQQHTPTIRAQREARREYWQQLITGRNGAQFRSVHSARNGASEYT
jgi:AraC-like DNA-binding protein